MSEDTDQTAAAAIARDLMRRTDYAAMASAMAGEGDGWPYGSLVQVALDQAGNPLLLLSDLAEHSRNIRSDGRVCLLFDGTGGLAEPLTGPRLSLLTHLKACREPGPLLERFLRYHPEAELYAGFADFRLYRGRLARAHLVAGFGRIHWLETESLAVDCSAAGELAAAEGDIVDHMNQDHSDVLSLIGRVILGQQSAARKLCGLDPEGFDLRHGRRLVRGRFDRPVQCGASARAEFVRFARLARARAEETG